MPFNVCVASDVAGQKINLELDFPVAPSMGELTAATEQAFSAEAQTRRPGSPPYVVSKFQIVDAISDEWVEVIGAHQLRHSCQCYAFQPHSTKHTESQGQIPAATKPRYGYSSSSTYQSQAQPRSTYSGYGPSSPMGNSFQQSTYHAPQSNSVAAPSFPGLQMPTDAPHMPENASHDEKVRIVFENIDANKDRVIQPEEMKRSLHMVLDFSTLTVEDLFRKADHDRDGVVNFAEWQRFAELYPTLLDSLYYRLKAYWDQLAAEQQIDLARQLLAQFEANERNAKDAFDRCVAEAEDAQRRLTEADRAAADAAARQRAAEDAARDSSRDVDAAKQNRAERERDLAAERDRERQAQQRAQEAARELEAAQRRLAGAQQGLADAEAAERRAAQALHDAQRDRERQQAIVDQATGDCQRAADRHNQLLAEIPRAIEDAIARLQAAEQALLAAVQRQKELGQNAADAAAAAAEAARMRDELARLLQGLRDRQEPSRMAWLEAQNALQDHHARIAELEAALANERDQRKMLDDQEKTLVEQEVKLREQRESLEEKEGALRDAHTTFFTATGRQSPGRSASRSPALAQRSPLYNGAAAGSPYARPY